MERKLKFTASRISELFVGGAGRTRMNYIYDVALEALDLKPEFTTLAMEHGLNAQVEAFDSCFKPKYGGEWFDEFVEINEKCGASPDVVGDGFVADMKCNYSQLMFLEQKENLPKKYYYQSLMQQMAMKVDKGYVCLHLTCTEKMCNNEYCGTMNCYSNIPIEERSHVWEIDFNEDIANDILKAVEDNYPHLLYLVDLMKAAEEVSIIEMFYHNTMGSERYVKLKDVNWLKVDKCFICDNEFYATRNNA